MQFAKFLNFVYYALNLNVDGFYYNKIYKIIHDIVKCYLISNCNAIWESGATYNTSYECFLRLG